MYPGKVGRDHLGLGSVSSDQILPYLSPGINVLTFHPRYHSFYVFLLDEFWRREVPRTHANWVNFYRPREFVFSIGAHLCNHPEHGLMQNVVGARITQALAAEKPERYSTATHYIDSPLGGYGLYYRSVMAEMGLILPGGPGYPLPLDVPSELGKRVAEAFRSAIRDTAYYRNYFTCDAPDVPANVIEDYISRACLCQLKKPTAADRAPLLDVFIHCGPPAEAKSRRATLRLLLDVADQTEGNAVDEDTFRQLLYFRAAEGGLAYQPKAEVSDEFRMWRLYQAREYYAFALNAMWTYLCVWGIASGGNVSPVPIDAVWQHLDQTLTFDSLATTLSVKRPRLTADSSFRSLLAWLVEACHGNEESFDTDCTLASRVHEHRLYRLALGNRANPAFMVAGMLVVLALIYLRFRHPDCHQRPEWRIAQMGSDGRLSIDNFVRLLESRLASGPVTIREVARWLYGEYVILQHQLVATNKLPDNTFRFRRESRGLRFYSLLNVLGFNDARYNALRTTLLDLGLCGNMLEPAHPLTADGREMLNTGDLAWTR